MEVARQTDEHVAELVQVGKISLALFLPQYVDDPLSRAPRGRDTGVVGEELARTLAARLGVEFEIVGYPTPTMRMPRVSAKRARMPRPTKRRATTPRRWA